MSDASLNKLWDDASFFTPKTVKDFLAKAKGEPVTLEIDSPGGSFFAGVAIYNLLRQKAGMANTQVTTRVLGLAGSAASIIALAGQKREIEEGAMFFVHQPQVAVYGNASELRSTANDLDAMNESIVEIYNDASNGSLGEEEIRELLSNETYITAKEAEAIGFASLVKKPKMNKEPERRSVSNILNLRGRKLDHPAQRKSQQQKFNEFQNKRRIEFLQQEMEILAIRNSLEKVKAEAMARR